MALSFTRKVNMSPGQRDTGDVIDAGDVNELQVALEDISLGTVPIPLAGIEGALGVDRLQSGIANVLDYGSISGDATATLQAAINAAGTSKVIVGPPGDYVLSDQLNANSGIRLWMPGARFLYPRTEVALSVEPTWPTAQSISAFDTSERFPETYGYYCTRMTVTDGSEFSRGMYVLIASNDRYAFDSDVRKAETRMVAHVSGNYVYVNGTLDDTYTTSPTIRRHPAVPVWIDGVTFTADGDIGADESNRARTALSINGAADARVRVNMIECWSRAIHVLSCVNSDFDIIARDCYDSLDNMAYGYGIDVSGAARNVRVRVAAQNCRHAITSGTYQSTTVGFTGAPRHVTVHDSRAEDCAAASFDTHPGAFDWVFDNCHSTNNNLGPETGDGQYYGFQNRGINTIIQGSSHRGVGPFLYDRSGSVDHDAESMTVVRGCTLVMTEDEYAVNGDRARGWLSGVTPTNANEILLDSCYSYNRSVMQTQPAQKVSLRNSVFRNCLNIQIGAGLTLDIDNCVRTWERSGTAEPILLRAGSVLNLHGYEGWGSHANSSLIRGESGPGTWTVNGAHVRSRDGVSFKSDDGSGTWDVTDDEVAVA